MQCHLNIFEAPIKKTLFHLEMELLNGKNRLTNISRFFIAPKHVMGDLDLRTEKYNYIHLGPVFAFIVFLERSHQFATTVTCF